MPYRLAVLNPRPGRKTRSRKRRARKGSTRMALPRRNAKGRFVKGHRHASRKARRARHRRSNPRKSHGGKRRPAMGYVQGTKKIRRRKLNSRRSHRRSRRRHNPRFSIAGITSMVIPATMGAAGALAVDVALGYLPIPAQFTTGYYKHGARILTALGVGWLGRKFLGQRGQAVAAGALTVAMYLLLKDVIVQFAPSIKGLGDYEEIAIDDTGNIAGYVDPAYRLGAYLPDGSVAPGVGAYLGHAVENMSPEHIGAAENGLLTGLDY